MVERITASKGYLAICKLLIENGADVRYKRGAGWTPLHEAAGNGCLEICECLIKHRTDVNVKDNLGETPLVNAANLEICNLLSEHGAHIPKVGELGYQKLSTLLRRSWNLPLKRTKGYLERYILTYQPLLFGSTIQPIVQSIIDDTCNIGTGIDHYICDLLYLYHHHIKIRHYLEHGFRFQNIRCRDRWYTKRYRLWIKRWQFEHHHNQIDATPLLRSSFSIRLTENICFVTTK